MALLARRRIIAVTGLADSGKTVLLTSLINHLQTPGSPGFDLRGETTAYREFGDGEKPFQFPYTRFRKFLAVDHQWPQKTAQEYRFRCQFTINKGRLRKPTYDVEFVDLPGERFVDTAMLGRTYQAWSTWLLNNFENDPVDLETTQEYAQLLNDPSFDESTLIRQYKTVLYGLIKRGRRLVSPSTFLLDTNGIQAPNLKLQQILDTRHSGLAGQEFSPLSPAAADRHPEFAKRFNDRYEKYKAQVVFPFYQSFRQCDRLLVVVDIPKILTSGPGLLNDTRAVVESVLDAACPPGNWFYQTLLALSRPVYRPKVIQRVCFVAAKADLCGTDARPEMQRLLQQMLAGVAAKLRGVATSFHAVAAIVSTESGPVKPQTNRRTLHGKLIYVNDQRQDWSAGEQKKYDVPGVPSLWPHDWKRGDFLYPLVFPKVSPLLINPPQQEGLDEVFRELLK